MPESQRSGRFSRFVFGLGLLIVALLVLKLGMQIKAADHAAAISAIEHRQSQQKTFADKANSVIAANPDITFSVTAIDMSSNTTQTFGTKEPMQAASVGKLLTATLFLHDTETRQTSLNQMIGGDSAKNQLQALIQQSDDTAWEYFNDYLGHSALTAYAQKLGLKSYDVDTNYISTTDIASLLKKLYTGRLLGARDTRLLLSFMQHTNYEDIMTPAVPRGDSIYHKVGLIEDDVNDAAIITSGQKSLILVIFTDGHGTQNWQQRSVMMQQITAAAIRAYFN